MLPEGEFLGLEQGRISRIETGTRPLLNVREVVGVANKLAIPAGKLGFTRGIRVGGGMTTGVAGWPVMSPSPICTPRCHCWTPRWPLRCFDPGYARLRALYAGSRRSPHAIAGDTDTAVSIGHQAIDAVSAVHSPRASDRLRVLNTALHPLHTSAGVAELRERLSATLV